MWRNPSFHWIRPKRGFYLTVSRFRGVRLGWNAVLAHRGEGTMLKRTVHQFVSRWIWNGILAAFAVFVATGSASSAERVRFMTNWKAQAEHGGFYQAIATGIYSSS